MLKKYIYVNGKIFPSDKPAIMIHDVGYLRGYGVFDFMRTYNGKIFRWPDNWLRFVNSAKQLGLIVPITVTQAEKLIYRLIKKNGLKEAGIRLALSGGPAIDDGLIQADPLHPTFAVLIEDTHGLPEKLFKTGAKLITFNYARPIPESKNFNYLWAIKLQPEKKKHDAVEILYTENGKVLECSTSNFFIVKGKKLITADSNVLPGITRRTVMELAKPWLKVEEREMKVRELGIADEAFITAANKKVLPIVRIDGQKVGDGKVGPITLQLMALFNGYIKKY